MATSSNSRPEVEWTKEHASERPTPLVMTAAQQAIEGRRPRLVVTDTSSLSPVVSTTGSLIACCQLGFLLVRPLLNGGTLGGRKQGTGLGLFAFRIRFDSELPSEETFRAELIRQAGSDVGLDGFEIKNNLIQITANLEPVTRPYAIKVLLDLGGVYVDFATREPRDPQLPPYTLKPWLTWPWWKRAYIHACFHLGLLSTALPARRSSRS